MKTMKKLCQATLKFVLVLTMVFGIGVTGVFADEIPENNQNNTNISDLLNEVKALDPEEKNYGLQTIIGAIEYDLEENLIDEEHLNSLTNIVTGISSLFSNIYDNKESYSQVIEKLDMDQLNDRDNLITYLETVKNANVDLSDSFDNLIALINSSDSLATVYNDVKNNPDSVNQELSSLYDMVMFQHALIKYNSSDSDYISVIGKLLNSDITLNETIVEVQSVASDNSLVYLEVNGLELDVNNLTGTVYVGYEVENLDVQAFQNTFATTVEIIKPDVLVVGDNEVKIIVTSLDGQVKEYVLNVIRLDASADQGDPADETQNVVEPVAAQPETTEAEVVPMTNNVTTTSTVTKPKEEKKKEDTKKETKKYEEDEEEKEGLNGFTVLLIVGGIALIGFGIYMLFGDKDDEIPTVKEVKKPNKNLKSNKNNNNKKRK